MQPLALYFAHTWQLHNTIAQLLAEEYNDFFDFSKICLSMTKNGHLSAIFQRPRRLNQAMKYKTTKVKKLLNLILSSYLRTLTCGRHRLVRILFLTYILLLSEDLVYRSSSGVVNFYTNTNLV